MKQSPKRVVVIGAGVGGLTTAAILAQAGLSVDVLEAHVYPGGCAGTFYHQKYRFDAGATLAGGFYDGGPMDVVAKAVGIKTWSAHPSNPAMVVHLPDGTVVPRWTTAEQRQARHQLLGKGSESFWRWQESTADALWDLALRLPPWPPQSLKEGTKLITDGLMWLGSKPLHHANPRFALDAFQPVAAHLRGASERLRLFVDAQLLIAAQTTGRYANALYGASALDLPRRGVVHFEGGMGAIAETLAEAVRQNGGRVHYKQAVTQVKMEKGRPVAVETKRRKTFEADVIIFNLPPWNIAKLLGDDAPRKLRQLPPRPQGGWGAFTVHVGLDESVVPNDFALHHQIIAGEPMGEANTVFLSLSPSWDSGRGPAGTRALTLSTHTDLGKWWHLLEESPDEYQRQKQDYAEQMIRVAETALPRLREAANLILPGTPVTFQRFTRREFGWVGGFPQTNLFRTWAPRLASHLWMVGDSIFPGQSTAAVAMGGLRVAQGVLDSVGVREAELVRADRFRKPVSSDSAI